MRVRREAAERGEEFLAQHAPVVTRNIVDHDGDVRKVRGLETHAVLRRLSALQDQKGALAERRGIRCGGAAAIGLGIEPGRIGARLGLGCTTSEWRRAGPGQHD
jgi:hypothetical protein